MTRMYVVMQREAKELVGVLTRREILAFCS